ncbi:hypothetical protein [Scopulibacillus darangshiensis]|uniref:hypothetical protein n=1 Tax=Scopulibacillus darangshiensis TaxID=442528 RepID=UPI001404B855|nr:hypothetical protein [Scopulibacillus darangshiensis]
MVKEQFRDALEKRKSQPPRKEVERGKKREVPITLPSQYIINKSYNNNKSQN